MKGVRSKFRNGKGRARGGSDNGCTIIGMVCEIISKEACMVGKLCEGCEVGISNYLKGKGTRVLFNIKGA